MIKDKTQALLDMLAGWAEFVSEQRERDEGETDEAYRRRLQDYPKAYEELAADLYQRVASEVEDDGLTPAEFLERRVLLFFKASDKVNYRASALPLQPYPCNARLNIRQVVEAWGVHPS